MSGFDLDPVAYFAAATFAAALVAGVAGFTFGLVAAVWLHILTPLQTATLIIAFGLIVQGYSVWKLRAALSWQRLWPFLLGAALGRADRRRHPRMGKPFSFAQGNRRGARPPTASMGSRGPRCSSSKSMLPRDWSIRSFGGL